MNDYRNPYIRIQTYFQWFSNDNDETIAEDCKLSLDPDYDQGVPISRLADITGIPLSVIRKDLLTIFKWQPILCFDSNHEAYEKMNKTLNLDDLCEEIPIPKALEKLILDGTLDQVPIFLYAPLEKYQLPLTYDEIPAFLNYFPKGKKTLSNVITPYKIKDSYRSHPTYINLIDTLDTINEAISNHYSLSMRYQTGKGTRESIDFKPLKIVYDSIENRYAVLTIKQEKIQVYRIDRIQSLKRCKKNIEIPNTDLLSIAPHVWGMNFSPEPDQIAQVKVKFYNEANVWNKVKNELSCRSEGNLYEKDGFLFYEDTVYGLNAFRTWIYGYGSSAIVIKPEKLRNEIIDSLKERRERFFTLCKKTFTL